MRLSRFRRNWNPPIIGKKQEANTADKKQNFELHTPHTGYRSLVLLHHTDTRSIPTFPLVHTMTSPGVLSGDPSMVRKV